MNRPALLLALALAACSSDHDLNAISADYVPGQVLLGVNPAMNSEARSELLTELGLTELQYIDALGVVRAETNGAPVMEVVDGFTADFRVRYVEPNYIVRALAVPNDPDFAAQWNLRMINAPDAWDMGTGEGVTVAVLDTGVQAGGPDGLNSLLTGRDFVYGRDAQRDAQGHGTHVSGTIAQRTNNGVGVAGVAPGVSILPVKVLGDYGGGDMADVAAGIQYAADQGAQVVNMSLGSYGPSYAVVDAEQYAHDRGVVIVAATGNDGANSLNWPAADPLVIAVGANDARGQRTSYSNGGQGIDLVAPGGASWEDYDRDGYNDGIRQEIPNGRSGFTYGSWDGTSMASPHVAAAAALIISQGVTDPSKVREILQDSAVDAGSSGYDISFGHGILDVEAAVRMATGFVDEDPQDEDPQDEDPQDEDPQDEDPQDEEPEEGGDTEPGDGESPDVDTTPPLIEDVELWTDCGWFGVGWTTDEPATSTIDFYDWGPYEQNALSTEHWRDFNASCGQTYWFDIVSCPADRPTGSTS